MVSEPSSRVDVAAGCATFKEFCDRRLHRHESTIYRMLGAHGAMREARRIEAERALLSAAMGNPAPDNCALRCCTMQQLLSEVRGLDAIITDPPYSEVGLYGELAAAAAKAVKPDGIVAVMTPHIYLPQILDQMCPHLPYFWTMAYLVPASDVRMWNLGINVQWKPVLLFARGKRKSLCDVIRSDAADKRYHQWQQSESGMMRLVAAVSELGQLVCDPFAGRGTTAVACVRLDRRFVGCDVDPNAVAIARARYAAALAEMAPSIKKPIVPEHGGSGDDEARA